MKYLIEDTNEIVDERYLRKYLFEEELGDITNNLDDYLDGGLDIEWQFDCIRTAKNGDMKDVIKVLNESWNVPIKEVEEIEVDKFAEILELIEDKLNEVENCDDEDITEEYLNGYKNGLDMAKTIVNELK